jgi:hypothetical protein
MQLKEILHSKNGKILMSIILGIGAATLFRKTCKERNCLVFKSPAMKDITNKVFEYDNKCYNFKEQIKKCNSNIKTVTFA